MTTNTPAPVGSNPLHRFKPIIINHYLWSDVQPELPQPGPWKNGKISGMENWKSNTERVGGDGSVLWAVAVRTGLDNGKEPSIDDNRMWIVQYPSFATDEYQNLKGGK